MKKAKAAFVGFMIAAVVGVSGFCLYLNKNGTFGWEKSTETQEYIEQNENNDSENIYAGNNKTDDEQDNEEEIPEVAEDEINDFLTVFAKSYFSENESYSSENYDTYELIRFAYSYISYTDKALIEYRKAEDGSYNCVSTDKVNEILEKYLGVTVPEKGVYTENAYSYFKYEDGYFLTLAADGLPYINVAKAEKITQDGSDVSVEFSVYCGEQLYSEGEAKIEIIGDGLLLKQYSVNKV